MSLAEKSYTADVNGESTYTVTLYRVRNIDGGGLEVEWSLSHSGDGDKIHHVVGVGQPARDANLLSGAGLSPAFADPGELADSVDGAVHVKPEDTPHRQTSTVQDVRDWDVMNIAALGLREVDGSWVLVQTVKLSHLTPDPGECEGECDLRLLSSPRNRSAAAAGVSALGASVLSYLF